MSSQVCFDVNPGGIIQILKSTSKAKNHYLLQGLEEKKLLMTVDMDEGELTLALKSDTIMECKTKIKVEGTERGKCLY